MTDEQIKYWYYISHNDVNEIIYETAHYANELVKDGGIISDPYLSREVLVADLRILPQPCLECLGPIKAIDNKLISLSICARCEFWLEKIKDLNNPNRFVMNGEMYIKTPQKFSDYGGKDFKLKRLEPGSEPQHHHLWFNGYVPEIFRDRIKDNAQIIP